MPATSATLKRLRDKLIRREDVSGEDTRELAGRVLLGGLIDAFNADDGHGLGLTATTATELADAIGIARAHEGGPVLVERQTPNDDASPELISWGTKVAHLNVRPHLQRWLLVGHDNKLQKGRSRDSHANARPCEHQQRRRAAVGGVAAGRTAVGE